MDFFTGTSGAVKAVLAIAAGVVTLGSALGLVFGLPVWIEEHAAKPVKRVEVKLEDHEELAKRQWEMQSAQLRALYELDQVTVGQLGRIEAKLEARED